MLALPISLLHVLPFLIEPDFPLMLLYGCTVYKHISLIQVLPFYVEQDFLLMLLDGCIARNEIRHLHVRSFCTLLNYYYVILAFFPSPLIGSVEKTARQAIDHTLVYCIMQNSFHGT